MDNAVNVIRKLMRPLIVVSALIFASFCIAKGEITGKEVWSFVMVLGAFYFGERSALKKPDGDN